MPERELPIIFSGDNPAKIIAGEKTQTRRVVERLIRFGPVTEFGPSDTAGYDWTFRDRRRLWNDVRHARLLEACPFGAVGDRLWVREGIGLTDPQDASPALVYAADGVPVDTTDCPNGHVAARRSIPAIFMPHWASRITLRVTDVRVQQLQQIGERDAWAEGARYTCTKPVPMCGGNIIAFREAWESIHRTSSSRQWTANPYVWAISFEIEGGARG